MTDEARRKTANVILIVLSALILIGVILTVYLMTADKNIIKVSIDSEEAQEINFTDLELRPGESCEYTLIFRDTLNARYLVELDFRDCEPTYTLKDYARLRIEHGGEVLCDDSLSSVFAGEALKLTVDFSEDKKNEFKIIYYMPEDVGNEAQNAEADFTLFVTADID